MNSQQKMITIKEIVVFVFLRHDIFQSHRPAAVLANGLPSIVMGERISDLEFNLTSVFSVYTLKWLSASPQRYRNCICCKLLLMQTQHSLLLLHIKSFPSGTPGKLLLRTINGNACHLSWRLAVLC